MKKLWVYVWIGMFVVFAATYKILNLADYFNLSSLAVYLVYPIIFVISGILTWGIKELMKQAGNF